MPLPLLIRSSAQFAATTTEPKQKEPAGEGLRRQKFDFHKWKGKHIVVSDLLFAAATTTTTTAAATANNI